MDTIIGFRTGTGVDVVINTTGITGSTKPDIIILQLERSCSWLVQCTSTLVTLTKL